MTDSWPEQPPSNTSPPARGHNKRTQRHKLNRWQKAIAAFVVVIVLGAVGGYLYVTFAKPKAHALTTTPDCLQGIRRGSFCTGVALKTVTKTELAKFTSTTGVFPAIVEYYQLFGKGFSHPTAIQVASVGARPLIQLNPHNVSLAAIAAGKYDKYIDSYAQQVKAFGHGVVLSFGHEMNGSWSTWSEPFTKPSIFVAAWRHIVLRFRHDKVKNVTWAWDISHVSRRNLSPSKWYPGNQYVDWVGIDGYLRPGQTFAGQFWKVIGTVRKLSHNKPVLITETAVAPGKAQAQQIAALFKGARQRHLMGLIWFDVNKKEPWQLGGNPAALAAFKKAAQG